MGTSKAKALRLPERRLIYNAILRKKTIINRDPDTCLMNIIFIS